MTTPVRRQDAELSRWDPVAEFNRIAQQLSGLVGGDLADVTPLASGNEFLPQADLEETDDAYLVDIELPGVHKKDVNVEVIDRRLVITGERKEKERVGVLRRRTRVYGRFRYEIVLPQRVDENNIDATLTDGVLRVRVPKNETAQHRRIEVR
jgi:HSP20 family protein